VIIAGGVAEGLEAEVQAAEVTEQVPIYVTSSYILCHIIIIAGGVAEGLEAEVQAGAEEVQPCRH
jgi:hypothetical protein